MKIIKTASGNNRVKINREEWEQIGKQAGWIKEAQGRMDRNDEEMTSTTGEPLNEVPEPVVEKDDTEKWYDSLKGLNEISSTIDNNSEEVSHHERSPASPWGTKEVYDGEQQSYTYVKTYCSWGGIRVRWIGHPTVH